MDKALYFPYINLPETDWTIRTLLYYDNVGSIVPQEYFYNPRGSYDPFMLKLVERELVIPINPMQALDNPWETYRPLMKFINSQKTRLKRETLSAGKSNKIHYSKFDGTRIHKDKFQYGRIHADKFRIHEEKFSHELFYHLSEMGLAKRGEGNWYYVEKRTAEYMMKFLATVISTKLQMRLTTDAIEKKIMTSSKLIEKKRSIILKELIPFPQELDLTKLRNFKDRHSELLKGFKNKVEQIVLDDTIKENSTLFKERVSELTLRKEELSAKMNESKFSKIFFGTVCGTIGAGVGLATTNSTTGAVVGAVPGFLNAIHSALQIESPESIFDQSGMKYIALVDKKLK